MLLVFHSLKFQASFALQSLLDWLNLINVFLQLFCLLISINLISSLKSSSSAPKYIFIIHFWQLSYIFSVLEIIYAKLLLGRSLVKLEYCQEKLLQYFKLFKLIFLTILHMNLLFAMFSSESESLLLSVHLGRSRHMSL